MKRTILIGSVLAAATVTLPGCVVFEIRDEMVGVNANLVETQTRLDGIRTDLDQTNERLDRVETQLGSVNGRLETVEEQLAALKTLESIDGSLARLDAHLKSLRKTLENIDSTIPFLSLTSDDEDDEDTDGAAEGDPAAPGTAPNQAPAAGGG